MCFYCLIFSFVIWLSLSSCHNVIDYLTLCRTTPEASGDVIFFHGLILVSDEIVCVCVLGVEG